MGSERVDQFAQLLNQLFERFKHDDGTSLSPRKDLNRNNLEDTYEKFLFEDLGELINFKAESEVARFNPTRPEYWRPTLSAQALFSKCRNAEGLANSVSPLERPSQNNGLPPDPINDEDFYSLQKRICRPVNHGSLMNESLIRCEASDDETNAESIYSDDDFEDFENEIKWYLRSNDSKPKEVKSDSEEDPGEAISDGSANGEKDSKNHTTIYQPNFNADKPRPVNQFHILQSSEFISMGEARAPFNIMDNGTTQVKQKSGHLKDNKRPTGGIKYMIKGSAGHDAIVEHNEESRARRFNKQDLATDTYCRFKPRLSSTLQLPQPTSSVLPCENNGKHSSKTIPVTEIEVCNETVPLTLAQRRLRQLNIVVPTITEEERLKRLISLDSLALDFLQVPRLLLKQQVTGQKKIAGMPGAQQRKRA